jgi:tryptophan synthase alpha chain
MHPIDATFQRLRSQRRKAFIPFVPAGDPDLKVTGQLVGELARRGASLIEVGFPYSDPIADGSVIQAAYNRALNRGFRLDALFEQIPSWKSDVPLVGMASYSLLWRRGLDAFVKRAREAGLSGLIVPDLPVEEAEELLQVTAGHACKLIQLVTPTTPRDRAKRIAELSRGFLYCVSVTGITGERDRLPAALGEQLAWLRTQTELPLCVGFGISKPEHVAGLRDVADGVIVGSAIVRRLEKDRPVPEILADVGGLTESLCRELNPERG